MKETVILFKNVINHPGQTVDTLREKSLRFFFILLGVNVVIAGALYGYGHFWMDPTRPLFWAFACAIGLLLAFFEGCYLGIYYIISKLVLKEGEAGTCVRIMGYYSLMAFTLYHLVASVVIIMLVPKHYYFIEVYFWDVSHIFLLFWIAALCVQGIQQLRSEREFRTMLKVFISLFIAYCIETALFLFLSRQIISLIYR